jgi:outer membrane protein
MSEGEATVLERRRSWVMLAAGLALAASGGVSPAVGQQVATPGQAATLTLQEAIALARRNNPDFLATANDIHNADWAVRGAYGSLLPGADASTSFAYQAAGDSRVGLVTSENLATDYYTSSYRIGLNYALSGSRLLAPGFQNSNRRATQATIDAAAFNLESAVTRQYLAVLRAQDNVTVSEQELLRAQENLKLADARVQVEAAIPMEAKQAQVEVGRAEVALLQARNAVYTERMRLMQMLGVDLDTELQLTTEFEIQELGFTRDQLIDLATQAHPSLRAAEASRNAANMGVKMARTSYLPSLSIGAGWSAFARRAGNADFLVDQAERGISSQRESCNLLNQISAGLSSPLPNTPADCSAFVLTPDAEADIRAGNRLRFDRDPFAVQLSLSLPLFNGLARERQLEEARLTERDASLRVSAERLRLRTEVATAYANLATARQSVALEDRNQELATEQLELARERYRVGVGTFLELQDAETTKARADRAHLAAMYNFHEALAALESAVGRNLRQGSEAQ